MTSTPDAAIAVFAAALDDYRLTTPTVHVYCCNPHRALCGHDISNDPEVPAPTNDDCVVCLDLEEQRCPHCGTEPAEATR